MSDIILGGYPGSQFGQKLTILSGASKSDIIATQGMALTGIWTPSNGWTAAAIGYRTGWNLRDADLVYAYDNVGNLEQTLVNTDAAAARIFIPFPQPDAIFGPYLQLVSVTQGTTTGVNQAADRELTLVFRRYLS